MAYKNFFYRLFFSLFFLIIFIFVSNNEYILFIFGTFIYFLIFFEVVKFFKNFFLIILIYILISFLCLILYFIYFFDNGIFNLFVFTIIFFDSFSFFSGKLFGKNYIFKFISPKKTLEGYLGGFFVTNIFSISYFYFIQIGYDLIIFIILLNLIIFFSIIGDLLESYFKRKNHIKDSSNYLPGHGGFFDRFDSFLSSIIVLTLFSFVIKL